MCAERGDFEEAELRHTQVLTIDRNHVDAMVQLGLCRGALQDLSGALYWLQRAQSFRPTDARIGVLLTQAAKALATSGQRGSFRPVLRTLDPEPDEADIQQLSMIVAKDPEFVDAFLALSEEEVNPELLGLLLRTLEAALEHQPEHAELRHHCGRVLERLGRREAAIRANERAVSIDPGFTRALIELGRLYGKTNRRADAVTRLESALKAGADYADVHYLLGSLYRDLGQIERARRSFERALKLNGAYTAAHEALEALVA
jgi:tetratricopeptide (TPR) repeat protein